MDASTLIDLQEVALNDDQQVACKGGSGGTKLGSVDLTLS